MCGWQQTRPLEKKSCTLYNFLLPSEISNESLDGVSPGLWVHPGVLAKVLHHMKVGTSLLTQPCGVCMRGRGRGGEGETNRREYNNKGAKNRKLIYVYKPTYI